MKYCFRISWIVLLAVSLLFNTTCRKDSEPKITKSKISGQVQKGPYVNGTSISMSELNSSLSQTGNVFTTQITNNRGSFEIDNISLTSSYVEFNANGYYFDEVKGDLSVAPLNLFALSDIRDITTVNVNIMTHLEKQRVGFLIKQSKSFTEAKNTAQKEILSIFGFSLTGIDNSEALDITVDNEANAILLAISVILQGNRSMGDLTELLANISNDIKEDGLVSNAAIIADLRNSAKQLNPATIRSNLEKRFKDLNSAATIPQFEKYVDAFLSFTGSMPAVVAKLPVDITPTNATLNGTVNPNSLTTSVFFEWGKTTAYGDSVSVEQGPVSGSSSVDVSKVVPGLMPGTTYHFRVKARNSRGTSYSDDLTFITPGQVPAVTTDAVSGLRSTGITFNATVNPNLLSTKVIFKWGTTTSYTDSIQALQSPVTGNSPVNLYINITGLVKSTHYFVRAYATNQLGTAQGNEETFLTLDGVPSLTTLPASSTSPTTGTGGGNITDDGGSDITSRGTCLDIGTNPTIDDIITDDGSGPGIFTSEFTGLTPQTTYYAKAYAKTNSGVFYGEEVSFTTPPVSVPSVTTTVITNVTTTTATGGGAITSDGGAAVTERGICFSNSANPTITDTKIESPGMLGPFIINLTDLAANTLYYVRAYAINSKGTAYGEQVGFRTIAFPTAPSLTTTPVTKIGRYSVETGGNILNDGGGTITERGVCYSTTENPTISDNRLFVSGTIGIYISNLTGLTPGTLYFIKAYATNSGGTAYGEQVTFRTFNEERVSDIDGNGYNTITIGTQVWTAENLKTTKFNDGTPVPYVIDETAWSGRSTPGYCWFDNDEAKNKNVYGALYNWFTVDPLSNGNKNLCPVGWHVPSDGEWTTLTDFLGGESIAGGKLKESGTNHFLNLNLGATNESSFTALPGGYRLTDGTFIFGLGAAAHWWSSTECSWRDSWDLNLGSWMINTGKGCYDKINGFSVRCIKD